MPAAAVIPAPIAYIKVVAVKKLVVGFWASKRWSGSRRYFLLLVYLPVLSAMPFIGCCGWPECLL